MTQMMNGLRPLTDAEAEAVTMHMQREHINAITARTGLSAPQIAAAVDQAGALARYSAATRAQKTVTEVVEQLATRGAQVETPKPATGSQRISTAALLAWADEHGPSRARTLAARIRESVNELRTLHAGDTARAEAAAEVERLTAELEAAKARLKEASGKTKTATPNAPTRPAGAVPDPDRKAHLAAVRTWARGQGHELSDLGRIPTYIVTAYNAAHGGTQ